MTPNQVIQSLEAQSTSVRDTMARMTKDAPERPALEQLLAQYDAQLERVKENYRRQGEQV